VATSIRSKRFIDLYRFQIVEQFRSDAASGRQQTEEEAEKAPTEKRSDEEMQRSNFRIF